jgi:hypothetical protein
MDQPAQKQPTRFGWLIVAIVLILGGGLGFRFAKERKAREEASNFVLAFPKASKGWHPVDHGPQTLFLYQQRDKGLLLRGAVSQVISDTNPTPNLDRDALAQLMVDNTHDNMPGWTADMGGTVTANGTSFRIVRRSQHGLVVVTAFAVKGNTTVLVSLSGRDKFVAQVDKDMGEFQQFVSSLALKQADLSNY